MSIRSKLGYFLFSIVVISFFGTIVQANNTQITDKTKEEVNALIAQAGSTSPDWWDSVELSIPANLDTDWPVLRGFSQGPGRDRGGRGGGRGGRGFYRTSPSNVDEYLTQVIYPNASRHKTGIKLVNHLMIMHQTDQRKLQRSLNTLGDMFYELLDDYARAAFWWQKYADMGGSPDSLKMARCYFELGSKLTAAELLSQTNSSYSSNNKDLIKLWAKIGEVDKALEMLETSSITSSSGMRGGGRGGRGSGGGRSSSQSNNYLLAAEILRGAGRYDEAIVYYQKVLALPDSSTRARERHGTDGKIMANYNLEATKLLKTLDIKRVPDGSFTATVGAYGGSMTVRVVVNNKKIESLEITRHRETESYLVMAEPTARQIVSKQGFEGVDVITGATVTSDAIIHAAAKALVNAME
ncbi:FMN-binding protein [Planctomycetota bacterium]